MIEFQILQVEGLQKLFKRNLSPNSVNQATIPRILHENLPHHKSFQEEISYMHG